MLFMEQTPIAKTPNAKQISTPLSSFELLDDGREDRFNSCASWRTAARCLSGAPPLPVPVHLNQS